MDKRAEFGYQCGINSAYFPLKKYDKGIQTGNCYENKIQNKMDRGSAYDCGASLSYGVSGYGGYAS